MYKKVKISIAMKVFGWIIKRMVKELLDLKMVTDFRAIFEMMSHLAMAYTKIQS